MKGSKSNEPAPLCGSSRLGLAAIGCFGFIVLYALRINISVAMVCMVNQTAIAELRAAKTTPLPVNVTEKPSEVMLVPQGNGNGTSNTTIAVYVYNKTSTTLAPVDNELKCPAEADGGEKEPDGEFVWDKEIQGHILGSFFYGYLVTQIPGGWFAARFGGRWVFGISMFIASVATILCPVAARVHYGFLIFMRVIVGLGSGVAFPCMHAVWACWAPPLERSKLTGLTYAGTQIGNIITLPIGGLLCKYGFDGGWPSIFYILGACGILWSVLWMALVSNTPSVHPRISEKERTYIMDSLKGQMDKTTEESKERSIPWRAIATSMPVWAIVVGNLTSDWGLYTFLTNLPTYFKEVLKFDIQSNGFYSAIPYIGFWAVINVSGLVADILRSRNILSTTNTRKVFEGVGQVIPAILLIGVGFLDCTQPALAVTLLALGVAISGAIYSGYTINHVDIAPRYAGLLFGISNTIASVTGFIVPYLIGVITKDQTREQWQAVFFIAAGVYVFGTVFYTIFASGEVQDWAKDLEADELELERLNTSGNPDVVRKTGNDASDPVI